MEMYGNMIQNFYKQLQEYICIYVRINQHKNQYLSYK